MHKAHILQGLGEDSRQATLLPYLFFLEADSQTQMRHVTSSVQHLSSH